MNKGRPNVRIRFKYNVDTGEIEEFIVDDESPARSEEFHDKVAGAISSLLSRNAEIEDAGAVRLPQPEPIPFHTLVPVDEKKTQTE
jgi:hypothetical protein